jgi:hypothetical protein
MELELVRLALQDSREDGRMTECTVEEDYASQPMTLCRLLDSGQYIFMDGYSQSNVCPSLA